MSRLPVAGSDVGTWGTVLNDYLGVAHNSDGTLKTGAFAALGWVFVDPPTGVAATDTANINTALAAASSNPKKPPVLFAPGLYVRNTAITPFTGMRLVALGRGSEFGYGTIVRNQTTDMFTPTADVSDIHMEGIQFEGNTATLATDWWTVGTGFQILYSHIDKCGFNGWKRVYWGNWTGVTFENFYCNAIDQKNQSFKVGGSDNIWGPGFIGSGGFNRTTLTATVTAGAGPNTITVADATGAAIGNPVYIGNQSDGASATRDVSIITNIAGTTLTIGTLANTHNSGEFVHIVLDTPAVETSMSHSEIRRLYISPGPGMALHVTGGHVSTFIGCELSGAPAVSAGSGLYVIDGRGHQFIGTNVADVVLKPFDQFTGAITVYDSTDISFTGTLFNDLNTTAPQLFRLGRSGGGGGQLTDRIKIAGTSRHSLSSDHVLLSRNSAMEVSNAVVSCDEWPPTQFWIPTYKTASYYFCNSPAGTGTANTLGNGTLRLTPWIVTEPLTITRIGAEFTAAGDAASIFRIGIYADDGTGVPTGSPILDAGSISTGTGNAGTVATGGTPGSYEITLGTALSLQPGLYWVGGAVQGVTVTQPTMRTVVNSQMVLPLPLSSLPAANAGNFAYQLTGVTGALGAWSGTSQAANAVRIFYKTQ